MKDTFAITKPKIESSIVESPNLETPAYVNTLPQEPSFQKIIIVHRKIFYEHHALNDKALLGVIRKHPEQGVQNLMLKEFSKIGIYKHNRVIGLFLMYGGMATSLFSLTSSGGGAAFLLGSAASITGSIIAIMNKNKRYAKRVQIAKIYNGDLQK